MKKVWRKNKKLKIAVLSLTSCEGCQFVMLDLGKRFFDLLKNVDLIDMSLIEEKPFSNRTKLDIVLVEGNPVTEEEIKKLKEMRKRAKMLIVIGNCAALGGIPEIKNYQNKEKTIRYIYKNLDRSLKKIANPEIKEVDNFVKVDLTIPGCPINGEEFLYVLEELLKGKIPVFEQLPVCTECLKRGTQECFLSQKKICFGPISLKGCGAVCPNYNLICRACRGFLKNVKIKGFFNLLKSFNFSDEEIKEELEVFGLRDDFEKLLSLEEEKKNKNN